MKKTLVLLLAMLMLLAGCGAAKQTPPSAGTQTEPPAAPAEEKTEARAPAAEETPASAEETTAEEPPEEPQEEKNGDVIILYTSDVHCGIDQGFGYVGVRQIRDSLDKAGYTTLLVDDGDAIQGEPVGTLSRGETIIELMNLTGYDLAIPGNHEFDYGMERFLELTEMADFQYICCNFNREGTLVFAPYAIRELAGFKVAFVGIDTPQTLSQSTPKYFMNDKGEFIYGFFEDSTGEALYSAVQSAVDAARAEGADYVVAMAHLGDEAASSPWTYADVISHTTGIDVLLDGHSHDSNQVVMKNMAGEDVIRSACGTKLAAVGWVKLTADGQLSAGLYHWNNDFSAPVLLGIHNPAADAVADAQEELAELKNTVVATTEVVLTVNDPVAVDDAGKPIRMVRRAETNLGDVCADAYLDQSGADIAFVNGGGIRANIDAGEITLNEILSVHPFGNSLTVIEVTGQQILDALEWGARAVPGELGGFVQPAGLTYEIHSYIDSGCQFDENSMFTGMQGEYRVKNVMVGGEPLDLNQTYTVASTDYPLLLHGDGFTMFDGCKVLQECVKLDNQVLIDYITGTLGGVVGEEYEDLTGQGRIVIFEEKP